MTDIPALRAQLLAATTRPACPVFDGKGCDAYNRDLTCPHTQRIQLRLLGEAVVQMPALLDELEKLRAGAGSDAAVLKSAAKVVDRRASKVLNSLASGIEAAVDAVRGSQ